MTFKNLFMPVGIVSTIIFAYFLPEPGAYLKDRGLMTALVVVIFLINGYSAKLAELKFNRQFAAIFTLVLTLSLIVSPFIGVLAAKALGMQQDMSIGLILMSSVPCTLSSAIVLTQIAGGNSLLALLLTIGLNFAGIITIPFMLEIALQCESDFELSPLPLLTKLLLIVLLPFVCGKMGSYILRDRKPKFNINYIATVCVIAAVWISISKTIDAITSLSLLSLLKIMAGALAVHCTLLILSLASSFLLKLQKKERTAILFTASQKTLPVAISVFAALNISTGTGIVVCIVFHFQQIFIDSIIATRLAK